MQRMQIRKETGLRNLKNWLVDAYGINELFGYYYCQLKVMSAVGRTPIFVDNQLQRPGWNCWVTSKNG